MSDLHGKKIGELKKMLREMRMKECPPINKMKKADVIASIEGRHGVVHEERQKKALEGLRKVEAETKVRNIERKEEVEKKKTRVKKAVDSIEKAVEKPKEEKKEKRTMHVSMDGRMSAGVGPDISKTPTTGRGGLIKGSQEAKDFMERIRTARKSKKESVD